MGKEWSEDMETFFAVKEAWRPLIEIAAPPMPLELTNKFEAVERRPPPPKDEKGEKAYKREMKAYRRSVKEADDLSDELTEIGRDVAAGLSRTKGKK